MAASGRGRTGTQQNSNPLDIGVDALREAASRPGALAPMGHVQATVARYGITAPMLREALENWESLELLDWPGRGDEVGLTAEAWRTQACHLDAHISPPLAAAPGAPQALGRPVALVSLFDGMGTARLALQDALGDRSRTLCYAGYAEIDQTLAAPVGVLWNGRAGVGLCQPYHFLCADVWDLLRADGERLPRLAAALPREALALVIRGSPCQDLTSIGPRGGRVGLCGDRSVHFSVFPVLAQAGPLYT